MQRCEDSSVTCVQGRAVPSSLAGFYYVGKKYKWKDKAFQGPSVQK